MYAAEVLSSMTHTALIWSTCLHAGSRCVMMGFLPFHDFISSPPVKHIHSRLSLTVRPFFINFSTNWSTKSSRGDQDDDDAEEAEDNAGPVDSLTSLVSPINIPHADCEALCGVCLHPANRLQLVIVYEARWICTACMQYSMHCRLTIAM